VSSATRSGPRSDVSSSGVGIDPSLLRECLHDLPGGEPFEVVGPKGHDSLALRWDVRLANQGQDQGTRRRRDMKRITVVADDPEAELAEQRNLVHGDLDKVDHHC